MDLVELFCSVDDFCQSFQPEWEQKLLSSGVRKRRRSSGLSLSEVMTILIHFHQSHYRNFKHYYLMMYEQRLLHFPGMPKYAHFVSLMPGTIIPLLAYLNTRKGEVTGISFVDSTPLQVCGNKRMNRNKVFQGIAKKGKSSIGWFFGFKLHLIVNEKGDLLACHLTSGEVDDRKPLWNICSTLYGKLFGDKGYISKKLFEFLWEQGVQLITNIRKNMKNTLIPIEDKLMLRKRSLIETINDQLKNISHIEHSRHRSPHNFIVNLLAGLIAYTHQPKKPRITPMNQIFAIA